MDTGFCLLCEHTSIFMGAVVSSKGTGETSGVFRDLLQVEVETVGPIAKSVLKVSLQTTPE